jgi:predicted phosphoribosyltransferase
MLFKNRVDAGEKLAQVLLKKIKKKDQWVVVSLLRGGTILGQVIEKKLKIKHLPLVVVKITQPSNLEYALGALTFSYKLYNQEAISMIDKKSLDEAVKIAQEKLTAYCQKFHCDEKDFNRLRDKKVILVDDGAATGLSLYTAAGFLHLKKVKKILLALPVASTDFNKKIFNETIILHEDLFLTAVSNYYQDFSQVDPIIQ